MKPYEVNPALQPAQELCQPICVALAVINLIKHSIFEAHPALTCKVILLYKLKALFKRKSPLCWHKRKALLIEWIMQTHRKMHLAVIQKELERINIFILNSFPHYSPASKLSCNPNGAESYPLWTPGKAPVCRKHLNCPHNVLQVVQRLSHTHKDRIGKLLALLHSNKLGEDRGNRKIPVKALPACHTEAAGHLAPHLRRDADSLALIVGNNYRFYASRCAPLRPCSALLLCSALPPCCALLLCRALLPRCALPFCCALRLEEVFFSAILRCNNLQSLVNSYNKLFGESLPCRLAQIGHFVN